MQKNINLSIAAVRAIEALQHKNGTYNYYRETLSRLHAYILHQSDEIGMSDTEALNTLRALDALSSDLADLAGTAAVDTNDSPTQDEFAERVDEAFSGSVVTDEDTQAADSDYPLRGPIPQN